MEWVEEKKSYYAIIPATVRYDKKLNNGAKLLYGEITALCNEKGYCWATNKYFADLYEVTTVTISRWISSLKNGGYISCEMQYKEGTKEVEERHIFINEGINKNDNTYYQKCHTPINKNVNTPINKNVNTPINKNVKDNNTYINNTINKEEDNPSPLVEKNNNKDISDSKSAVMVRAQVLGQWPGELGEVIVKWYNAVGIRRKITFNQIEDKLKQLQNDCHNDAKLVVQQINNSYLNNYPAWYPPKENTKKKSVFNSVSVRPGEIDESGYTNDFIF